jgi:hypothetical protein
MRQLAGADFPRRIRARDKLPEISAANGLLSAVA